MPAIPYPGGKARLAKQIISFLPREGRTYLEPFAGRANLFWAAAEQGLKFRRWWLNDINTAPFLEAIKLHGHKIEVPPRSKREFEKQREAFKYGDPTAIVLSPYFTFSGGGFRYAGKGGEHAVSASGYQRTLRECHRILTRIRPRVTALDWQQLGLEKLTQDDVVVLDPPYPNAEVKSYTHETVDYERLVDVLLRAKFRWLLCGYPHPVLHRLGKPIWARDMQLLCVHIKSGQEDRTECLWSNFSPQISKARLFLPPTAKRQIRAITDAASLSFNALDEKIDAGLGIVARDWAALIPYLLEMNRRLSAPGKRTDLRKGAPVGLLWTAWVETKRHKLGRSLRAIQYMLRGKTEASRDRQMLLARPHAGLRSEPDWSIPDTPMEIATEMSQLVLEMRDTNSNEKQRKQRLALLAEHFLRITGQHRKSDSIDSIDIGNRRPGGFMWKM
jgi:site-specific DNA-adenine methylase